MSGPVSAEPPSDRQPLVDKNGLLTPYGHRLITALWQRTGGFEDDVWKALGLGFTGLTQAGQLGQQVGDLADGQKGLEGAIASVRGDPRLATADRAEDKADDALVTALSRAPAEVGRRVEELERTVAKLGAALGSTQAQLRQNVASQQSDFREAVVIAAFNAGLTAAQSQNALNKALEAAQEVQDEVDAITAGFDSSVRAAVSGAAPITFNSGTGVFGWNGTTTDVPEGTRLYYTDERVDDRAAALIQNGGGITWTYNDGAGTLTPAVAINDANWSGADLAIANGGTGSSTAPAARIALGLLIGTDVQAFHANLAAVAGLSLVADRLIYANGTGTLALTTFTSFGRSLVDDADAATARATLALGNVDNTSDANKPVSTAQQTALDLKADYVSGTFTPALKFGGASTGLTYSQQAGRYTKTGRLVTAEITIVPSALGSSTGSATITGLPYAAGTVGIGSLMIVTTTGLTKPLVYVSGSTLNLANWTPTTFSAITQSNLSVGTEIYLTISYSV